MIFFVDTNPPAEYPSGMNREPLLLATVGTGLLGLVLLDRAG